MELPGWVIFVIGIIVTLISYIVYAKDGSLLFFVYVGVAFILYGLGKMLLVKLRQKDETEFNQNWQDYNKPTTLKQLPTGQAYYQQQYRQANRNQATNQPVRHSQPHPMHAAIRHTVSRQVHVRPIHQSQYVSCRHCGARHNAHANFCANCGQRMN